MRCGNTVIAIAVFAVVIFAGSAHVAQSFRMFEAVVFSGTPNFARLVIGHLRIVDSNELRNAGASVSSIPTVDSVRKIVATGVGPSGFLVLDLENWTAPDSNDKFCEALARFHAAAPSIKLGLCAILPQTDYWRVTCPPEMSPFRG